MQAALIVGETLTSLGLRSVPKTSGATGIQIIVPIRQGVTFDELRDIGHFVGKYVTQKHPDLFTLERLKRTAETAFILITCSIMAAKPWQHHIHRELNPEVPYPPAHVG